MSLNPPLMEGAGVDGTVSVMPNPYANEFFFLMRDKIDFEVIDGPNKFSATGRCYMTSHRFCFQERGMTKTDGRPLVHKKTGQAWAAIDIPMLLVSDHKFNQPIFGANSLSGACTAIPDGGFVSETIKWKIKFKNGGVGTFLPIFFRLMEYIEGHLRVSEGESKSDSKEEEAGQSVMNPIQARQICEAYLDPNDPTHVYVQDRK